MYNILHFDEINSTSVYSHQHLEELQDFQVVSCDLQTQGHGQFERVWFSSNKNGGNIYISIILKPNNIEHLNELTRYVALIGAKTLEEYGLKPSFKYPNDILINGKKIAGFLAESEFLGTKLKGVIVGCGINLNLDENELKNINIPATSIYNETKKNVNKQEFLEAFLNNFKQDYDDFLNNGLKGEKLC
ncbi:MAG: biotin--[Candidatus Gastranaerophilales bacterium]|nr:biotin--[acetyl-CoA-carboxylase] ligase [Candidatus Gastranaerophilales bacterium]